MLNITTLRSRVKVLEAAKADHETRIAAVEARPAGVDQSAELAALAARVLALEEELANPQ